MRPGTGELCGIGGRPDHGRHLAMPGLLDALDPDRVDDRYTPLGYPALAVLAYMAPAALENALRLYSEEISNFRRARIERAAS